MQKRVEVNKMPKFENWTMVEEETEWENDLTEDRVMILRPKRAVSRTDEEWRVILEGSNATDRVPYPDVNDRMGIGRGQSEPERGLITKLPRRQDAVEEARKWMREHPMAEKSNQNPADLHFKMIKSGLNIEEEVVKEETVKSDSNELSEVLDEYFISDEDYVLDKIKENQYYGESVGQGLRSQVREE